MSDIQLQKDEHGNYRAVYEIGGMEASVTCNPAEAVLQKARCNIVRYEWIKAHPGVHCPYWVGLYDEDPDAKYRDI